MNISILCSSESHPIYPLLVQWHEHRSADHTVELVTKSGDLQGGDILFLISCDEIIGDLVRSRYSSTLVIHASDVPAGRGWSPHIWQVLEGKNDITVTLLEAADKVDTGAIWAQLWIHLEGHELYSEINERLFAAELELMDYAVENFKCVLSRPQPDAPQSYYRRRTPEDSRIDPSQSIARQFELLRVADPERFPAFFDFRGHRYRIRLDKLPIPKE